MPDGALVHFFFGVIARTTSGDLVCIGVAPGNHGEVWFWSHDHPVREEATWKLADDLDAFLATFHGVVVLEQ